MIKGDCTNKAILGIDLKSKRLMKLNFIVGFITGVLFCLIILYLGWLYVKF